MWGDQVAGVPVIISLTAVLTVTIAAEALAVRSRVKVAETES